MITRLNKLNYKHQVELLEQAEETLEAWQEAGKPEVRWDGYTHECHLGNDDETVLVLYRCECGEYIADYDDYSGRDEETDTCPRCRKHYDE